MPSASPLLDVAEVDALLCLAAIHLSLYHSGWWRIRDTESPGCRGCRMLSLWGLAVAFIYAGPRWVISLAGRPVSFGSFAIATMEFLVALAVGALAAGAFGPLLSEVALTTLKIKDHNAISAVIGLFANRLAPALVEKGSSALTSGVGVVDRVLKALKADEKNDA